MIARAKPVFDPFLDGSAMERRVHPRRTGNHVSIIVSDEHAEVDPVHGWIQDRSASGLCLILEEEGNVDPGTVLSVRPTNAPRTMTWVHVVVVHTVETEEGWRLGCRFIRSPRWDVMLQFG